MRKTKKPYIGITLDFATRIDGCLSIERASFLAKESSLSGTIKFAHKIAKKRSWGDISSGEDFIKYLGLEDVFSVVGPIGHGAMMGQTSKFSYKTREAVEKKLSGHGEFVINKNCRDKALDDLYIVKFVYFVGKPIPYRSRRALLCWGIVKSSSKDKVPNEAVKLAKSPEFKRKIVLRDYEEPFPSELLEFVGISDIRPLFEQLKVGNYFLNSSRRIRTLSEINKLNMPNPKVFKYFFEDGTR